MPEHQYRHRVVRTHDHCPRERRSNPLDRVAVFFKVWRKINFCRHLLLLSLTLSSCCFETNRRMPLNLLHHYRRH